MKFHLKYKTVKSQKKKEKKNKEKTRLVSKNLNCNNAKASKNFEMHVRLHLLTLRSLLRFRSMGRHRVEMNVICPNTTYHY